MTSRPENIFANLIANRAEDAPNFAVLTVEGGGQRPDEIRTYQQLWDNGRRLAKVLLEQGVRPGERFALLMANHVEFVEAMTAASIVGTAVVPMDPRAKGDKLRFMLENADCSGAFAADYALDNLAELRVDLPKLRWALAFATDEGTRPVSEYPGVLDWTAAAPNAAPELPILTTDPDASLELIFTSGTTGDPKGIVMTHRRYCETSLLAMKLFGYVESDRLCSGLSLTHANAQLLTLGAGLANRLPIVLSRRFTKSRLWDITRRYGSSTFTLLGGMTTAVYGEPPKPNDSDNPVRFVVAAGMPSAIWREFERRFGVKVMEFYGAAEGGLTFNPPGAGPVGSIGKPPAHLKYRIVDELGHDVQRGEPGELLFRHANEDPFVVEYFGNPLASALKCAGGWLRMGDIVHEDENGWLYFDCRKGGGIRRNGEFINAGFVEKAIAECPEVDDVHVYGIATKANASGEKCVVAAIVPRAKSSFSPQKIFAACRARLEPSQIPDFVQVLQAIPKTASEKIQERFLVEAFEREPHSVHRRP